MDPHRENGCSFFERSGLFMAPRCCPPLPIPGSFLKFPKRKQTHPAHPKIEHCLNRSLVLVPACQPGSRPALRAAPAAVQQLPAAPHQGAAAGEHGAAGPDHLPQGAGRSAATALPPPPSGEFGGWGSGCQSGTRCSGQSCWHTAACTIAGGQPKMQHRCAAGAVPRAGPEPLLCPPPPE